MYTHTVDRATTTALGLNGRTALVTDGGEGIGFTIVDRLPSRVHVTRSAAGDSRRPPVCLFRRICNRATRPRLGTAGANGVAVDVRRSADSTHHLVAMSIDQPCSIDVAVTTRAAAPTAVVSSMLTGLTGSGRPT